MSESSTLKLQVEPHDKLVRTLVQIRGRLAELLYKKHPVTQDVAEDAASEVIALAMTCYDPVEMATIAAALQQPFDEFILARLFDDGRRYLNREQGQQRKFTSENTPIGEFDDGEMVLGGLFTKRSNSAEQVENFAEVAMFFRKHGRAFSKAEMDVLIDAGDNVSLIDAAKELGLNPDDVMKLRALVLKRAQRAVEEP